jgi:hypothetical protein
MKLFTIFLRLRMCNEIKHVRNRGITISVKKLGGNFYDDHA